MPTPNQYQHKIRRTATGGIMPPINHWTIGLLGEVNELAKAYKAYKAYPLRHGTRLAPLAYQSKVLEELGDCLWYMANLAHEYQLDFDAVCSVSGYGDTDIALNRYTSNRLNLHLWNVSAKVGDYVKKTVNYPAKYPDPEAVKARLLQLLQRVVRALKTICACTWLSSLHGCAFSYVMQLNLVKLAKRFPSGFSLDGGVR